MKSYFVESFPVNGYSVLVKNGLMKNIVDVIRNRIEIGDTAYIVTDNNVAGLYLSEITSCFSGYGIRTEAIVVPAGEESKNMKSYTFILEELMKRGMMRRSLLILVGGGMIMDLGGFVGATVMRGVPIVNIPTSLIAQVDAAVGGKVAINNSYGKNSIGNFYNPKLVCIDPTFLLTLRIEQIQEGLAEIIKVATIHNVDLFEIIERQKESIFNYDLELMEKMISLSVESKIELLRPDPLEVNLERVLNFGHTLAHPLETMHQYNHLTHGKAVGLGMSAATLYAMRSGYTPKETGERIRRLIREVGLPTSLGIEDKHLLHQKLDFIIRVRNGNLNLVVPVEIGKALILPKVIVSELIDCLV
jgi:3-dehydroquinate synthase